MKPEKTLFTCWPGHDGKRERSLLKELCRANALRIIEKRSVAQRLVAELAGSEERKAAVAEWYRYQTVAWLVTSSSPVPPKTRRVGQRCTLNLSRAETSSRWCGVVVRRGGCQLRCRPRHLTMVQNYVVRHQKPSCS
ncbi:uncharacterized protein TNCV_4694171 [Trichonephila clavipes]|uniref:Uncharacterized protein n=1 Tax=Trichonephila clavipes TaxID=2585209 RepID=A0A8X6WB16_TRICX|nr:uncharacterized protein TNCV_4694171 [Trichonephila clavipes]